MKIKFITKGDRVLVTLKTAQTEPFTATVINTYSHALVVETDHGDTTNKMIYDVEWLEVSKVE